MACFGKAKFHPLLPAELQFLLADCGPPFTADLMMPLAPEAHFIPVVIAPSQGMAERLVRTLKEGLVDQSWQSAAELGLRLNHGQRAYHERPPHGLSIPGLSLKEFAKRIRLL